MTGKRRDYCSLACLINDSIFSPSSWEIMGIVHYTDSNGISLIVGCSVNSINIIWASTKSNPRWNKLLHQFFASKIIQKVIDLTARNKDNAEPSKDG